MRGALLAAIVVGAAAPSAAADPEEFDRHIAVEVLRRSFRRADEVSRPWPTGFHGLELVARDGPQGDAAVAGARAALTAFALSGDAVSLADDLHALRAGERLLGLAGIGHAMRQRYGSGGSAPAPGVSLGSASDWMLGVVGPSAGRCGAIHDSLRRLAAASGFGDAVTMTIGDRQSATHVVTAIPTADGWAVIDYGSLFTSTSSSFANVLELASAMRGRVVGESNVFDDAFLYRAPTVAGIAAEAFLTGAIEADALDVLSGVAPTTLARGVTARWHEGVHAADGTWSWADRGVSAWGTVGWLQAPAPLGGEPSPATAVGALWDAGHPRWIARAAVGLGAVGWNLPGADQLTLLAFARGAAGYRIGVGTQTVSVALLVDTLGDLASMARGLAGRRSEAFVERARAGLGVSWTGVFGDAAVTASTLGWGAVAPGEVRTEVRTIVADEAVADVGVAAGWWRCGVRTSARRITHALEARVGIGGAALGADLRWERAWSVRPVLEPHRDRLGAQAHARVGRTTVELGADWTQGRGSHASDPSLAITVRASWSF